MKKLLITASIIMIGFAISASQSGDSGNNTPGYLGRGLSFDIGSNVHNLRPFSVGDLNGDYKPDVILSLMGSGFDQQGQRPIEIRIFLNSTPGDFLEPATTRGTTPLFSFSTTLQVGPSHAHTLISGLTIADLNLDGNPDIAATTEYGVLVYLGYGNGTFVEPPIVTTSGADLDLYRRIAWGNPVVTDLNSDAFPDVAVTLKYCRNQNTEGAVGVFLANGDGSFQSMMEIKTTPPLLPNQSYQVPPFNLRSADLNTDGRPDLIMYHRMYGLHEESSNLRYFGAVTVLVNAGNGTFETPRHFGIPLLVIPQAPGSNYAMGIADFDGDGHLDVLCSHSVVSYTGEFLWPYYWYSVLRGTGDDSLFDRSNCQPEYLNESCSVEAGGGPVGTITSILPDGSQRQRPYPGGIIASADMDLDGKPDLVLYDSHNRVYLMMNTGNGRLAPVEPRSTASLYALFPYPACDIPPGGTHEFAIADISGDGTPDIVTKNIFNLAFSTILNTAPPDMSGVSIPDSIKLPQELIIDLSAATDHDGQIEVMIFEPEGFVERQYNQLIFRYSVLGLEGTVSPEEKGILVTRLLHPSPLEVAGVLPGDIIFMVDGVKIMSEYDSNEIVVQHFIQNVKAHVGRSITLTVKSPSGGGTKTVFIPERPRALSSEEMLLEYQYSSGDRSVQPVLVLMDNHLAGSTIQPLIELNYNQRPIANAGGDQIDVSVGFDCMASVTLDGSQSSDPDGNPLNYSWTWDDSSATGVNPTIQLPLGTHTITLVVNDGNIDSEPDYVEITVIDDTPPTIELSDPECVNVGTGKGKMANKLTVSAEDNCSEAAEIEINIDEVEVFDNGGQLVEGKGVYDIDGYDIYVYPNGKGWSICVTITATDSGGNFATERIWKPLLKCKK